MLAGHRLQLLGGVPDVDHLASRSTARRWMWMRSARYPASAAKASSDRPQRTLKAGNMPSRKKPNIVADEHEQDPATPCGPGCEERCGRRRAPRDHGLLWQQIVELRADCRPGRLAAIGSMESAISGSAALAASRG